MPAGYSPTAAVSTPLVEIVVTEELTGLAAMRLRALLADAIGMRPQQLIVDLSSCPLLDATGVQVLLDAHRTVWRTSGRLTLRGLSPRLRRILELARVDHVFHITDGLSSTSAAGAAG